MGPNKVVIDLQKDLKLRLCDQLYKVWWLRDELSWLLFLPSLDIFLMCQLGVLAWF